MAAETFLHRQWYGCRDGLTQTVVWLHVHGWFNTDSGMAAETFLHRQWYGCRDGLTQTVVWLQRRFYTDSGMAAEMV